ncbi:MAG: NAD-dependent epimerase/dehydratase family protein [Planctomycetes bacterium]|nr:NAD-dependent epimerase/dehydratase family protein [Planctomycetota bacterium]
MSPRLVLITGATGFLCSNVARQLATRGDEVHALARPNADKRVLDGVSVQWHAGDLTDRASLERTCWKLAERSFALRRPWDLVHGAALISYKSAHRAAAVAINVEGTRAVLQAARQSGVARVVHVSSVVTVGACRRDEVMNEATEFNLQDCGVDYVTTKRAAEEIALAAAKDLDLVVVNPGAIFGPVERRSNTARFIRQVALGKGPLAAPPGTISVLGVDDAAAGTVLALDRGRRGERYLLVESWIPSRALFDAVAREFGTRGPLLTIPRWAWPLIVLAARVWDRFFPLDLAPPQGLVMLARELRFDAAKARSELGWSPKPFAEVLKSTIQSLEARGQLRADP